MEDRHAIREHCAALDDAGLVRALTVDRETNSAALIDEAGRELDRRGLTVEAVVDRVSVRLGRDREAHCLRGRGGGPRQRRGPARRRGRLHRLPRRYPAPAARGLGLGRPQLRGGELRSVLPRGGHRAGAGAAANLPGLAGLARPGGRGPSPRRLGDRGPQRGGRGRAGPGGPARRSRDPPRAARAPLHPGRRSHHLPAGAPRAPRRGHGSHRHRTAFGAAPPPAGAGTRRGRGPPRRAGRVRGADRDRLRQCGRALQPGRRAAGAGAGRGGGRRLPALRRPGGGAHGGEPLTGRGRRCGRCGRCAAVWAAPWRA